MFLLQCQSILLFCNQYEVYSQGGSSDSFWDKFYLSILTSFITFGLSLLIAYLVFRWNRNKENTNKQLKKTETELELINYVITSLEQNVRAVKKQKEFLEKFIESIKTISDNFQLIIETSVMFDWVKSIDTPKFRNVFFKYYPLPGIENKRQDFVSLLARSNHLTVLYSAIESYSNEFVTLRNTDQLIYRDAIILLEYKVITRINKTQLNEFEKELSKLHTTYASYSEDKRGSLIFTNENLLKPMKELVEKYKDYELWKDLEICMGAFNDVSRHFANAVNKYTSFVKQFDTSSNYIDTILQRMLQIPEIKKELAAV